MEYIQKNVILEDEGKYFRATEMREEDRRAFATISDVKDWTYDIKSNAVCKLKIDIEEDLWNALSELSPKLQYKEFSNASRLKICYWPECDVTDILRAKFDIFKEDIAEYIIMGQYADQHIFPHIDPIRETSIYIPLLPRGIEYTPLELYYNNDIVTLPPNDRPAVYAWNTKIPHSVFQFGVARYNVQMVSYMPYHEFFQKYKSKFDV